MTDQEDPGGRTPRFALNACNEAVTLLLNAGTLGGRLRALDAGEDSSTRELQRDLTLQAGLRAGESCGIDSPYSHLGRPRNPTQSPAKVESLPTDASAWRGPPRDELEALLARSISCLSGLAIAPAPTEAARAESCGLLWRSVMRPICDVLALASVPGAPLELKPEVPTDEQPVLDSLRGLYDALGAAIRAARTPELVEAAAGVERLLKSSDEVPTGALAAPLGPARIQPAFNGPYLVEGEVALVNHLGVSFPAASRRALCRCGASRSKPYCDGSHAGTAFNGAKDPRRVADKRDTYRGQQALIFDNRGLCAHSGFCTDRLKGVFHLGEEPFVTPSGGRLDDIMAAVRSCPSGALSVGLGGKEDRSYGDADRPAQIEVSKDGPYRITGGIELVDEQGAPASRPAGASHEHYSLCRCGASLNKPFCSGAHWSMGFADPRPSPDHEPTLFEWAGGYPALLEMTRIFYSRHVPGDPLIGRLFAAMSPDHPERVAAWLSEVFGGPNLYSERYGGYSTMISHHVGKRIAQEQRSRWATLMAQSAEEAGLPIDAEFRSAFIAYLEWGTRIAVENSQDDAQPPPNMPVPRWWWVCNATPSSRISALKTKEGLPQLEDEVPHLGEGELPSFVRHIKGLFRVMDRSSMRFAFDLWRYEDVRKHADGILARVRAGTMPCDKAWSTEKVALFEHWLLSDMPE